ncbi:hypothetical protein C3747_91g65 [Trypanosoma cruzi]|uniref:EF-hand domain-containing protein n=1 Tax=Trypanosoma cruzi TaxID=5693 RepID=A0A2V2WJ49_TRYCR|nr:hypothetical protein C3747_91g65 [Trypanosoma cruzi]
MQAAERFVSSLLAAREEEEERREVRRRRRIDFIIAGNKERTRRCKDNLSVFLRRDVHSMSLVECNFLDSLGDVEKWWDLISKHILEEKREREEAVKLQNHLKSMYLETTMRREETEQSSVVVNDERRLQELEEWCLAEERRTREEVIGEVMHRILAAVDECIGFTEKHALESDSWNTSLGRIALNAFIRKINMKTWTEEGRAHIAFKEIFNCHPFQMTCDAFVYLLHAIYNSLEPGLPQINRFDLSRRPLFLMYGPKFSGKTVVSRNVAAELSLLSLSDRDLIQKALEAYRNERNGLPTLLTVEDSNALPVLSAYEERSKQDDEIAYYSEAHIEQVVVSFVRLSSWAEVGKTVEEALFRGESVDPFLIVQLMQLQMADTELNCDGILFDSTVRGLEQLRLLQSTISKRFHPFEGALRGFPACMEEVSLSSKLLLVQREGRPEASNTKSENRSRPPKKGVDLSALPPPVLPEVIRLELSEEEKEAIKLWEQQGQKHSLFPAVVRINCGTHEIFCRFAGLRVDKETNEIYHMLFDPPPPDRLPYVVNFDRVKSSTAQLHRVLLNERRNWEKMRRWMMSEGDGSEVLHEVDGERPLENIVFDVRHILQEAKNNYEAALRLYDAATAAKRREAYIEANIAEQEEAREAERKRLVALYTEFGASIPPELEPRPHWTPFYKMPDNLPEAFMRVFLAFRKHYESAYDWLGTAVEKLATVMLGHRCEAMGAFHRFWNQPDEKQEKLSRFVENYNRVLVELPGQTSCKEELHLLVDQLREELFRTLDTKWRETSAKTEQLTKKELFLDPWCVSVCNVGIAAVQAELERFLLTINLVAIYFGAVVNEPCMFEELDLEVIVLRTTAESVMEQTKGREKKTQSTKKTPRLEEISEKTLEDTFVEAIGKIVTAMENFVEKISSVIDAPVRTRENTKTSVVAVDNVRVLSVLNRCFPFAKSELAKAQERISCIRQFFLQIQREGEAYCARMKEDMISYAREKNFSQASAVNTAIYIIRNAIEEEKPLSSMHLGRDTFHTATAEKEMPRAQQLLSPQHLQMMEPSDEPKIHATLSSSRLVEIILAFRSVAPGYTLGRAEFFNIVRPDDYAGATASNLGRLKTQEEVFTSFDSLGCGFIDWREFVVHLLLWCAPAPEVGSDEDAENNFYFPEFSVENLLETRTELGLEAVTEDVFYDVPFFFDDCLNDDRLEAYVRALWMTFSTEEGLLEPLALLAFFCSDRQPIRGAQKAFYVFSREQDGKLTPEELDFAFHVQATNPRDMRFLDAFSPENIAMLYDGESLLAFQSVCERVIGRTMLNNTKAYQRKLFITDDIYVE